MNKKVSKWMIGALALAVFSPTAAFAATNTNVEATNVEQAIHQKLVYDSPEDRQTNQQELMQIINKYNPDLADDFQQLFEQQEKMKVKVDEATKKKLDEIREQVKNGTLTQEQANEKLGVKGFDKFTFKGKEFEDKENIMEQIKIAADADDADTVNKLLQELLEKMKSKKTFEAKAD
ncbi:hypothetical protein O0555_02990 [Brevibacillus laterosporus]|uniref:hypothetical protein n=2 Tax=Brevibacillus laterosporus TaxID=1465 RepID=UPI00035D963D|nr:hypothetical protein [Brevibacillus laterosporus]ATO51269.1 hypothetical protein BrL25_20515 [Brevibacillus laterosporus DSM 25]AYB38584.1 hypothetical protein D5F52_10105 [Brevibacillus laterosporus]MBG9797346.1 hypothetical protein [Brevibacillus laterosporus]MBG9804205.1 hypothetical protein [Brevibacillus laterosporus]MCR8936321.1 hypothetical protein [Brevibacillus laterosporus]